MKPIVQKYGGTSVGSIERIDKVAERIAALAKKGEKLAIVVSAMSGETNRLVDLCRQINPNAHRRHFDLAVSAGEQVSVALLAASLEKYGVGAKGFLGYQLGIFTDNFHSQARIQSINTDKIQSCWERGEVPVIAGFQGISNEMEITTLGRGGSDTSAVAVAVALKADSCEINTDVDGIYTTDPRIVPQANLLERVDFEVALEAASLGGKVLHSRSVEIGAKFGLPIIVRNTFKANDSRRTIVMKFNDQEKLEAPVVSVVTLDHNVAKLTLEGLSPQPELISEIFELIGTLGANIDIIVHNKLEGENAVRLGFTVEKTERERVYGALQSWLVKRGESDVKLNWEEQLAKVSAVGLGMRFHSGVAGRAFTSLARNGVDIHMISTSEIKISCVVKESDAEKAVRLWHAEFMSS